MKQWKRYFRYRFNLIEIVLAMGVVGIGIAGVMSMMAPALSANRDALQESVAAEAAGKIMALIEMMSRQNGGTNWATQLGSLGTVSDVESGKTYLAVTPHAESDFTTAKEENSVQIFTGNDIFLRRRGTTEFFDIVDRARTKTGTEDSEEEIVANARIYVIQSQSVKTGSSASTAGDFTDPLRSDNKLMRFVIEVSWPANVSYASPLRQFRYFTYEVANPGA